MHNFPRCALLLMVMLCALAAPLFAQPPHVRVVNQTAAPGGNGQTWATAYTHPQQALDEAAIDPTITEIWVAAGVYVPSRAVDPEDPHTRTFLLQNNLALYGGFAGTEETREERDYAMHLTVLSGGQPTSPQRVNHVVRAESTDRTARLDGFTVRDGFADAHKTPPARGYGGGLHIHGSATIANCIIRNNYSTSGGGGIWNNGAALFQNCLIFDNSSISVGGADLVGTAEFVDCTLEGNQGDSNARNLRVQGSATFSACNFRGGSGSALSASIRANPGALFTDCNFENHPGNDTPLVVQGRYVRCIFRDGGQYLSQAILDECSLINHWNEFSIMWSCTVRNSRFYANRATLGYNSSFRNCLIYDNIMAGHYYPLFRHSTVTQSTVINNGVTHFAFFDNSSISNSIVWGSPWHGLPDRFFHNSDIQNSLIPPGLPEIGTSGNFSADPRFITPEGHIGPGSPAIDAGNNTLVPASITTDLDGNPRFHDDPGMPNRGTPGGHGGSAIIDLGAYEFQGESCYANCDNSSAPPILNIDDFTCFINRFAAADPYANCDASTTAPTLNIDDFTCFINAFAAGCP